MDVKADLETMCIVFCLYKYVARPVLSIMPCDGILGLKKVVCFL